jgi:hypothetical protein
MVKGPLDVFIASSTAGGTGSGAALDMAFLVREICADLEVELGSVSGVFMHVTGTVRQVSDVQAASTISFVRELQYFSTPGVVGPRGLAQHAATDKAKPFDHNYVVHLGDGLSDGEFSTRTRMVGDYLYANAVTSGRADFQYWRELENANSETEQNTIRTFGLTAIDEPSYRMLNEGARVLCRAVTNGWIQDLSHQTDSVEEDASADIGATHELLTGLKLTDETISSMLTEALKGDVGRAVEDRSRACCDTVAQSFGDVRPKLSTFVQRFADEISPDPGSSARPFESITQSVVDELTLSVDAVNARIKEHIYSCLEQPQRIYGAETALGEVLRELHTVRRNCSRSHDDAAYALDQLLAKQSTGSSEVADSDHSGDLEQMRACCRQFCALSCSQAICGRIIDYLNRVCEAAQSIGADLLSLRTHATQLSQQFSTPDPDKADSPPSSTAISAFDNHLRSQDRFRLADLLDATGDSVARTVLIDQAWTFLMANTPCDEDGQTPRSLRFPESAQPVLSNTGGGRRVLAAMPESASSDYWSRRLIGEFGDCISLCTAAGDKLSVCCEVEGIRFESVLAQFTHHNPHLDEVAGRLHSRNDVEW